MQPELVAKHGCGWRRISRWTGFANDRDADAGFEGGASLLRGGGQHLKCIIKHTYISDWLTIVLVNYS